MMDSILDCAKWFVEKSGSPIEQSKLQSLCYYSQAWSFAMLGTEPIFSDCFRAFANGPQNQTLSKFCKRKQVVDADDFEQIKNTYFLAEEVELLELVWDIYGGIADERLSCLIKCDQPWKETRMEMLSEDEKPIVIPFAKMIRYYEQC